MNAVIFNTQEEAQLFSDKIDGSLNMPVCTCHPKCGGIPDGGGHHIKCLCIPPDYNLNCEGVTKAYQKFIKHPILSKWAYSVDSKVNTVMPKDSIVVVLTSDWLPSINI